MVGVQQIIQRLEANGYFMTNELTTAPARRLEEELSALGFAVLVLSFQTRDGDFNHVFARWSALDAGQIDIETLRRRSLDG